MRSINRCGVPMPMFILSVHQQCAGDVVSAYVPRLLGRLDRFFQFDMLCKQLCDRGLFCVINAQRTLSSSQLSVEMIARPRTTDRVTSAARMPLAVMTKVCGLPFNFFAWDRSSRFLLVDCSRNEGRFSAILSPSQLLVSWIPAVSYTHLTLPTKRIV